MRLTPKLIVLLAGITLFTLILFRGIIYITPLTYEEKKVAAQKIFIKLQKYSDIGVFYSKLKISESHVINAYASDSEITITRGMLNYLENESEIAAVLGHEIAHVMLEHVFDNTKADQKILESNSDKYSSYLMMRAGYDVCQARMLWYRLYKNEGNNVLTIDHPSYADRFTSLDFPQCSTLRL